MNSLIDIENKQLIFNGKNVFMIIDENKNPWFKGKDVANILEFTNTRKAIIDHVREKHRISYNNLKSNDSLLLHPNTIFINEPGLYSLIMKSKM